MSALNKAIQQAQAGHAPSVPKDRVLEIFYEDAGQSKMISKIVPKHTLDWALQVLNHNAPRWLIFETVHGETVAIRMRSIVRISGSETP